MLGGLPADCWPRCGNSPILRIRRRSSSLETFYRGLVAGDPVDLAVTEARQAVHSMDPEGFEWATPVVFMRTPDGHLYAPPGRWYQNPKILILALIARIGLAGIVVPVVIGKDNEWEGRILARWWRSTSSGAGSPSPCPSMFRSISCRNLPGPSPPISTRWRFSPPARARHRSATRIDCRRSSADPIRRTAASFPSLVRENVRRGTEASIESALRERKLTLIPRQGSMMRDCQANAIEGLCGELVSGIGVENLATSLDEAELALAKIKDVTTAKEEKTDPRLKEIRSPRQSREAVGVPGGVPPEPLPRLLSTEQVTRWKTAVAALKTKLEKGWQTKQADLTATCNNRERCWRPPPCDRSAHR